MQMSISSKVIDSDSDPEDDVCLTEVKEASGDGQLSDAGVESISLSDSSIQVKKPTYVIDLRKLGNIVAKPEPSIQSGRIVVRSELKKVRKNDSIDVA